ncbi:MAG: winged helix-turn-helix transcriptional regulator [Candidatus Methanomethylophilaceae archaeon]|nr:winged helix-turn-helix transcriptional regulator [Candidatus Methanomethylophilaceae archaeon]
MGSQDEYLRNFAVLLTEKGVVPLTDPMQISVYNSLTNGMKRPSDISSELGIPSSSLHFVLDKMVDSGIIVRSKPDPGKKSVYYSNLALKIAGSFEPDEYAKAEAEDTFNDPSRYYSGMSSVANMLDVYTSEIGLDMDQMRGKYASDLADAFRYDIGKCGMEDAILKIRDAFAHTTGFKFNVFALTPLTLVFEGDRSMRSKMDMMTQFVIRAVENSTGRTYTVSSLEDFGNGDSTRMKVVFDRIEKVPEPYMNLSLPHGAQVDRFMMVELDGTAGLMTSDVQIDIVDAVYERPLCITDIVNKVNAPRSTVTSNLLRMVEEGMVSVFYSESGSAYYGLSCSILMKRSRHVSRDPYAVSELLSGVADREGAFMEGYLLYTLTTLRNYGFDTDYMMVVLGAKYMRAAGRDGPKNFDVFFGKMSDIAQAIGLSLNVVSVYPLTIGISSRDSESEMSPAMTFVRGMAHQGLEMASNGIFVRNVEETPEDSKVSFREIYPALSMTPVDGQGSEELAAAAGTKKKRTSSVKTALLNRSAKENGKPARTVRYITGVIMMVMLAAVLIVANAGGNTADADTYSVNLDDSCPDLQFFDEFGNEIDTPGSAEVDSVLRFTSYDGGDLGTVRNGVAYPLQADDDGIYSVTVRSDMTIQTLYRVTLPETGGYSASFYNFDSDVDERYAFNFTGYIDAVEYGEMSGGLWISEHGAVCIEADDGNYVSTTGSPSDTLLWERYICWDPDMDGIAVFGLPENHVTIDFDGEFLVDGRFVSGDLKVRMWKYVSARFVSTDGPVTITATEADGDRRELSLYPDSIIRFFTGNEDLCISYEHRGIA